MRQCLKERPVGVSLPVVEVNLQYLKRKLHGAEDVHKVASREEGSSDDRILFKNYMLLSRPCPWNFISDP